MSVTAAGLTYAGVTRAGLTTGGVSGSRGGTSGAATLGLLDLYPPTAALDLTQSKTPYVLTGTRTSDSATQDFAASGLEAALLAFANEEGNSTWVDSGLFATFGGTGTISSATSNGFTVDSGASGLDVRNDNTMSVTVGQVYRFNVTVTGTIVGTPDIRIAAGPTFSTSELLSSGTQNYDITVTGATAVGRITFNNFDGPLVVTINSVTELTNNVHAQAYDVTGNGYDWLNATTSEQPLVVEAGVVQKDALGNVALVPDGIDDALNFTEQTLGNFSLFFVGQFTASSFIELPFIGGSGATGAHWIATNTSSTGLKMRTGGAGVVLGSFSFSASTPYVITVIRSGTTVKTWINGAADEAGATVSGNLIVKHLFRNASAFASFPTDNMLIYNSDQSANRTAIEALIAAQHGITL